MLRLQLPLYKAREQKLNGKTFGRKQPQWQIAHPKTNGLHFPPSLNDPHVLGDGTIYVIIQASSQQTGTLRYAVVLALPHLTLPTPTNSTSKDKWPLPPPPLPQRSPRIRRRHNLRNYTSLISTNRNFEVCSSVGAPPPNTSTYHFTSQWNHQDQ